MLLCEYRKRHEKTSLLSYPQPYKEHGFPAVLFALKETTSTTYRKLLQKRLETSRRRVERREGTRRRRKAGSKEMAKKFAKWLYDSKEWAQVREGVLSRDKYVCQICGRPAQEVHHIVHLSKLNIYDPNITLNPSNLISLCRECHCNQHHKDRGEGNRKHGDGSEKKEVRKGFRFDENGQLVRVEA